MSWIPEVSLLLGIDHGRQCEHCHNLLNSSSAPKKDYKKPLWLFIYCGGFSPLLTVLNLQIVLITRQAQGQLEHVPSVPGSLWLSCPVQPHSWQAALPGARLHLHQDYHVDMILSERRKQEDRRAAKCEG